MIGDQEMSDTAKEKLVETLTKQLISQGKLIEAGFVGYRMLVMHPQAPQVQVDEVRMGFFAGAQHVFGSIMTMLSPGDEPSDEDMKNMDAIHNELKEYIEKFKREHPGVPS